MPSTPDTRPPLAVRHQLHSNANAESKVEGRRHQAAGVWQIPRMEKCQRTFVSADVALFHQDEARTRAPLSRTKWLRPHCPDTSQQSASESASRARQRDLKP